MLMIKRIAESGISLVGILLLLVISLLGSGFGFLWGYTKGVNSTYSKWMEVELGYQAQIAELQQEVEEAEQQFKRKEGELNERIKQDQAAYDAAIAVTKRDFTERLRKSEGRAKDYANMSHAGALERAALADHAAKLDRSLEEGRHLVRELRETLGQREREIKTLGEYILNVHQLINKTENSDGTTDSGNS